ncbi:hypothetical protein JOF56_001473 [Kibdelosporangium banguiense]|uniref:Uncharacterized protein n=1 Tax=Kibdelosporangium banguiense TaxID=1365924 RepID=A0ABS4T9L3_9PSEU|nr:hypothetical protein [Kibdelosporangium banguiense]MBP2321088.1 hypothetical protein [Kibdelosporangium banguiense]
MSNTTELSNVDQGAGSGSIADETELAEMVAYQTPRVFAIVLEYLEYGERVGAEIVAWGMALDEGAYVITVDGVNQYLLDAPENALHYLGCRPGTTPRLVWAVPA